MEEETVAQSDFNSEPQAAVEFHEPISWTASEYITHEKSRFWYVLFIGASVALTAFIYFIVKDILASIAVLVVSFSAGFFASRPPTSKKYTLSQTGLKVDDKNYNLGKFKSFSIVEEGAINSIWLKPLGRFVPFLIVYFLPQDEEKIAKMLNYFLAYEPRELDFIDKAMKRLRF